MTVIVEGRLVFEFGSSWQVEKYDEQPIHTKGIQILQRTKAMDFVGSHKGQPYLIEVKDFSRYRIENKQRLKNGDLAIEVALKVRDTLAGLVGALHGRDAAVWRALVAPLFQKAPRVLLWLEEVDGAGTRGDLAHQASILEDKLKELLCWLSPHVSVKNQRLQRSLPDMKPRNLSNGIFNLRDLMKKQPHKGILLGDFCRVWPATPQDAGVKLKKLCDQGILRPPEGKGGGYTRGDAWEQFHEDP